MATISSTLQMYDVMTRPLNNIVQALNMTISTMENLQRAADRDNNISKNFDLARQRIADAEAQLNMMASSINDAENQQRKFNDALQSGEDKATGLIKKVAGFVGAYLGYRSAKGFLDSALNAANEQLEAEQRLQSIMGNINGMTQDGINLVKDYAKEIENATGVASNVGIFGQSQLAQYVYDPANIVALTDSMYNLATETYGVGFTMDQVIQTGNLMGKVMLGDINALSRNGFNMDAIFTKAEQQLLKTGTEAERAALVIEMIEENLDGLAIAMRNTPEGSIHALGNAWGSVKTIIGYGLIPIILQFVEMIETNMPLIEDIFVNVFDKIFLMLQNFMEISGAVVDFFIDNWSWIGPILWGIVAAIAGLTIAIKGAAIAQGIFNSIMGMNPIVRIITIVLALVAALIKLWQTNDKFVEGFMKAWNGILNFFDKIPAYFWQLVEWLAHPFKWWAMTIGKIYDGIINSIIGGINTVLGIINKVTGSSFELEAAFKFEDIANDVMEYAGQKKDEALANAAMKAIERDEKLAKMMGEREERRLQAEKEKEERFSMPDLFGAGGLGNGMWDVGDNTLLNVDKVGEVGKIKDKVDISSEDIKMMRELAEMKNIQNFVTLTPTVSVQTGDITSGHDLDTIVAKITKTLEEDISSSASGAWGV